VVYKNRINHIGLNARSQKLEAVRSYLTGSITIKPDKSD
jgi:hypothetical protein